MPAKNVIKEYVAGGYYHLYNRGVEKRPIFLDQKDYGVFLNYLKESLTPRDEKALMDEYRKLPSGSKARDELLKIIKHKNFAAEIKLLAYCLMPNHFHFLIQQITPDAITRFMNALSTRYSMYFNNRYQRVGSLFQGPYKGVYVDHEEQFIYLTYYIHKQIVIHGENHKDEDSPSGEPSPLSEGSAGCKGGSLANGRGESLTDVRFSSLHPIHKDENLASAKLSPLFAQPSSLPDYLGQRHTPWLHPEDILKSFSKSFSYEDYIKSVADFRGMEKIMIEED